MATASTTAFKERVKARHFKKTGFEYVSDGFVWSFASRREAVNALDKAIGKKRELGWKVVRVDFSFECSSP